MTANNDIQQVKENINELCDKIRCVNTDEEVREMQDLLKETLNRIDCIADRMDELETEVERLNGGLSSERLNRGFD